MNFKSKYKNFSKHFLPLSVLPVNKLFKFYKSKWKKVQTNLILEYKKFNLIYKFKNKKRFFRKKKSFIKNHSKLNCTSRRWVKYKFFFRNALNLKKKFKLLFGNTFTNWDLKKLFLYKTKKTYSQVVQNFLLKPEFKINILLWRLNFFSSCFNVQKNIKKGIILVNKLKIKFNISLVLGNIIEIPKLSLFTFSRILKKIVIFYTFLEIDYYTNTIIIVKDLKELNSKDFYLLTRNIYNLFSLKNFILN